MPPKGWRKNAEGQYPQISKESELISIDDILFPRATVMKLAKNMISGGGDDNMILAKDSAVAVQRSATVFVSHLMFHARQVAKEHDRKTVNAQDILGALERAEFAGFTSEVKQKLTAFENNAVLKKKQRQENKTAKLGGESNKHPAAKKFKDNSEHTIIKDDEDRDGEEEDDDEDEDEFEDAQTGSPTRGREEHDFEDREEDDIDEDAPQSNPIALLDREETELGGDHAEAVLVKDEDASSDDE